MIMSDFELDLV